MAGHHIHTQQLACIDHVLALGPQRSCTALPRVTTVQEQGSGSAGLEPFDQTGQMRKAPHFAKAPSRSFKIQISHAIGLRTAGSNACNLEQMFAHQVRQSAFHAANA